MSNEMYEDIDGTLNLAENAGTQEATETTQGTASETAAETHEEGTETTGAETGAEGSEQTEEEKAAAAEEHKKKTGSQRSRERAERLERENQALRDALARGQNAPAAATTVESSLAKPDPNDPKWKSHEEYEEARIDYLADKRIQEREQKAQARAEQESWAEREKALKAKHEDYQEAFDEFAASQPSAALKQNILKSGFGPEIVHFLGNNPDELQRINALDSRLQAFEIGELRARFKNPPTKPEKKTTQAPPPIRPLAGASKPVVKTASTDAYEQY